ncbi:tryptophan halogenase family protein [Actinoplanes sp. NPDC051411]|uniref:tryptophan halogenase family protein n=1 Tax=Actinoplanes sp. NPDC051411 TaxID=3155522 RepID=UPI003420A792
MTGNNSYAIGDSWAERIGALAAGLPSVEGDTLAALLADPADKGSDGGWRSPLPDREREAIGRAPARREDDPDAIRTVGVIGGGTAGYLTALALRARRPWLDVTLIESSDIPVIGVGEATTPPLLAFLHHYLGIDPHDFLEKVRPTWKLGIKFDWGPYADGIMAPFDWGANSIGVLGSLAERNDPNAYTLQSLFMLHNRVPVFRLDGERYVSLMDDLPFAYHLENRALVKYLTDLARERSIKHLDAQISDVELSGEDWIDSLRTTDGRTLEFDLYIDATGFRSKLLGQTLKTEYTSYSDSLFTDTAVTGYTEQSEAIEPYTTAATMDAGWCWSIPVHDENHVGYVHSSAFMSADAAADEIQRQHGTVKDLRTVKFRSGRYDKTWRGNVIAVGNAYAFVEPLESSSLLMLVFTLMSAMPLLPDSWKQPAPREVLNRVTAERWDGLRWFLALHYRYNRRRSTPFWQEVWTRTDVSGIEPLLEIYAGGAPLHLRDPLTRRLARAAAPTFYELDGVDCMLLGQNYPATLVENSEPPQAWRARKAAADVLVSRALTQREALKAFHARPELTQNLVFGRHSWVTGYGEERWLRQSRA